MEVMKRLFIEAVEEKCTCSSCYTACYLTRISWGKYLQKAKLYMYQGYSLAELLKHESQVYPDMSYNPCYKISYGTIFRLSATAGAAWPTVIGHC